MDNDDGLYYQCLNYLDFGCILVDDSRRITFWNNWLVKVSQIPKGKAIGRKLKDVFPDLDNQRLLEAIEDAIETGASALLSTRFTPHPFPFRRFDYPDSPMSQRVFLQGLTSFKGKRYCLINIADVSAANQREQFLLQQSHEFKDLVDSLENSRKQLRNFNVRLEAVREDERSMLAREVHDELGQALTAIKLDVSWMLQEKHLEDKNKLLKKGDQILDLIDLTIKTVQKIARELRPAALDVLGLIEAIDEEAKKFSARTGLVCNLKLPEHKLNIDSEKSIAVFRIFQETLTNIARHAKAKTVDIDLSLADEKILLSITDDGVGVTRDQLHDPTSYGIMSIKERALALDGNAKFIGNPGEGTIVNIEIPHAEDNVESVNESA
jgi:signal transduction histidine kinase